MRTRLALGAGMLAAGLVFSATPAGAQEDPAAEIARYKQRTEALEKKMEDLERSQREQTGATEDQIEKVAQRLAKQKQKPTDFTAYWKDGLNFETSDKAFKLHLGGRLHYDFGWLGEDADTREYPVAGKPIGDQLDGTELRRLRFQMDGSVYENTFYKLEVDFAGSEKAVTKKDGDASTLKTSTVVLKDAFIGVKDLVPYATLQVGHFKEPFSLEELTSDNYITFLERALPNAFAPSYNAGLQLSNSVLNDRATWAAGVFRDTDDRGYSQSEGGYNVTGRVTGLPWYEDNGANLLHLGASVSYRDPKTTVQYSARPEMHLASKYVDTGSIEADSALLLNAETAFVYGPFSAQGELMQSRVNRTGDSSASFGGGYVQASYFLTGEHRPYKQTAGVFDRVHPANNYGKAKDGSRGWGAWEVAARYSYLDLNGSEVRGGRLNDATLGLNWYLNPNVRFMADYTRAMLPDKGDSKGGDTDILGIRFQVDF